MGGKNHVLDSHTHPTAFGEGDEVSIEPEALLGTPDPAVGVVGFGVGEDGRVHVDEVVRFAYGGLVDIWVSEVCAHLETKVVVV